MAVRGYAEENINGMSTFPEQFQRLRSVAKSTTFSARGGLTIHAKDAGHTCRDRDQAGRRMAPGMSGGCRPSLHDHAGRRTCSIRAAGSGAWRENAIVKLARP